MMLYKKLLFSVVSVLSVSAFAAGKPSLGIAPVSIEKSVSQIKASSRLGLDKVSSSFETELEARFAQSGIFVLVERKLLKSLRLEQDLNASGLVEKAAAQKYKLTGAKYIVFPKIDSYESVIEVQKLNIVERREESRSVFMTVSAKIIDASTGTILQAIPSVEVSDESASGQLRSDQTVKDGSFWHSIGKSAAEKLVQGIAEQVRPAKVLAVNGSQILINRGSFAGFKIGRMVACYATEVVVDEDTGEEFINEIPVATAVVVRGDQRKCFAKIKGENLGVAKGCIVRLANNEIQ